MTTAKTTTKKPAAKKTTAKKTTAKKSTTRRASKPKKTHLVITIVVDLKTGKAETTFC